MRFDELLKAQSDFGLIKIRFSEAKSPRRRPGAKPPAAAAPSTLEVVWFCRLSFLYSSAQSQGRTNGLLFFVFLLFRTQSQTNNFEISQVRCCQWKKTKRHNSYISVKDRCCPWIKAKRHNSKI